jgi:hypothetical protein
MDYLPHIKPDSNRAETVIWFFAFVVGALSLVGALITYQLGYNVAAIVLFVIGSIGISVFGIPFRARRTEQPAERKQ